MADFRDPELDELFEDPRDRALAGELSRVRYAVEADPAFRSQLRRQLMDAAWERSGRRPWWRRAPAAPRFAFAAAAMGALLIAVAVYSAAGRGPGGETIVITPEFDTTHPTAALLSFNQPMDEASVERAIQVVPATAVSYQWVSETQVRIVPVAGTFAPNTQYQVTLTQDVAKTASGATVAQAKTAVFTVAPTPAPTHSATPTPSPTPTPTPSPLGRAVTLAPAGPVAPGWSDDGASIVYQAPGDKLLAIPAGGGSEPATVVPGSARWFFESPDHKKVLTGGAGNGIQVANLDGTGLGQVTREAAVTAGWRADAPVYATDHDVVAAGARVKSAQPIAAPAAFSADGNFLLYTTPAGPRLLEVGSGNDVAWSGTGTFVAWTPDSAGILTASPTDLGHWTRDGRSRTVALAQPGVTGAAYLPDGRLLVSAGGNLYLAGDKPLQLGAGGFDALSASPTGKAVAWIRGGQLMAAPFNLAPAPSAAPVSDADAAAAVKTFMDARVTGDQQAARALLSERAAALYNTSSLLYTGDPKLSRWFAVYSGAGRFDVRLVLSSGNRDVQQLDEVLTVSRSTSGTPQIVDAAPTPLRPYGKGPEVISVTVTGTQMRLEFDSDLDPVSVATGIRPLGASAAGGRTVVVTGTPDQLAVLPLLRDSAGHPSLGWTLAVPAPGAASPPRS